MNNPGQSESVTIVIYEADVMEGEPLSTHRWRSQATLGSKMVGNCRCLNREMAIYEALDALDRAGVKTEPEEWEAA